MRRATLLLATMTLIVLVSAGLALAATRLDCQEQYDLQGQYGMCTGTLNDDTLIGTVTPETIDGLGGDDTLNGYASQDTLYGGPGNDKSNGGDQDDLLEDTQGTNTLNGGAHNDLIRANFGTEIGKINAGSGDFDVVQAFDGAKDTISCGSGYNDYAQYDANLDTVRGCEVTEPRIFN